MAKELKRCEVDKNLTWDLSPLFSSDKACIEAFGKLLEQAKEFKEKYSGKIHNAKDAISCLKDYRVLVEQVDIIGNYVFLGIETDYTNAAKLDLMNKGSSFQGELSGILSFLDSDLSLLSDDVV